MRKWTAALVLAWPALCAAADTVVTFAPERTRVEFTLGDVLHTVHGTFRLKRGEIRFDPATGAASGALVVDATSGDSGSGARDRRMHKNILESERYPDIVFTPQRVEGPVNLSGSSHVRVYGVFRIHGADHPLALDVQTQTTREGITATTKFVVPYVQWGMKNPSTFILRVSDKVDIAITAQGAIAEGATVASR